MHIRDLLMISAAALLASRAGARRAVTAFVTRIQPPPASRFAVPRLTTLRLASSLHPKVLCATRKATFEGGGGGERARALIMIGMLASKQASKLLLWSRTGQSSWLASFFLHCTA